MTAELHDPRKAGVAAARSQAAGRQVEREHASWLGSDQFATAVVVIAVIVVADADRLGVHPGLHPALADLGGALARSKAWSPTYDQILITILRLIISLLVSIAVGTAIGIVTGTIASVRPYLRALVYHRYRHSRRCRGC